MYKTKNVFLYMYGNKMEMKYNSKCEYMIFNRRLILREYPFLLFVYF